MSITVTVHANEDDALIAWRPNPWPEAWEGFILELKDITTGETRTLNNRIPPRAGETEVPTGGIASTVSPFLRCIWTDHRIDNADKIQYRVTPVIRSGSGYAPVSDEASDWTTPTKPVADAGDGLSAYFNRGTIMSQIVSRYVGTDITVASLLKFKGHLSQPGFPARRYLAGHARHEILTFLADADRRGSEIYAALYELNDQELIDALKPFGCRGNVLIGNGSSTKKGVADELSGAELKVHERDLSKAGRSSPSVHNKFVVERNPHTGASLRALTGSTNWTTTGLCTQLNNVLVLERPKIADRYYDQWKRLVAAGDDLPDTLVAHNSEWTKDGSVSLAFAATTDEQEFEPVLDLIKNAEDGLFFLMFTPGQSPLLDALLVRSEGAVGPYVRGVVSEVRESAKGDIISHGARVIRRGEEKKFRDTTLLPDGLPKDNLPSWAREEFNRRMFFPAKLNAIVHSKVVVVDPFSDNCAVITGSHNFSDSASEKNDENLVIIRRNKALAQAYAVHIQGVYDHYSWRAFLGDGGNPDTLFKSLKEWRTGGSRERDLAFWVR